MSYSQLKNDFFSESAYTRVIVCHACRIEYDSQKWLPTGISNDLLQALIEQLHVLLSAVCW